LRLVRLLRVFKELRFIMHAIMGCGKIAFYSFVLIAMSSFLVGVCFVHRCTDYLNDPDVDPAVEKDIKEYWGSVLLAMLSMYMSTTGGADWNDVADSLRKVDIRYYGLFLAYIGFYQCILVNALTSLFVEATMDRASKDLDNAVTSAYENKEAHMSRLRKWFHLVDIECKGAITYAEFCCNLDYAQMVAFSHRLGIDVVDVEHFFILLSRNGTEAICLRTFVLGCIKLGGTAKSMHFVELLSSQTEAFAAYRVEQQRFESRIYDQVKAISDKVMQTNRWVSYLHPPPPGSVRTPENGAQIEQSTDSNDDVAWL